MVNHAQYTPQPEHALDASQEAKHNFMSYLVGPALAADTCRWTCVAAFQQGVQNFPQEIC